MFILRNKLRYSNRAAVSVLLAIMLLKGTTSYADDTRADVLSELEKSFAARSGTVSEESIADLSRLTSQQIKSANEGPGAASLKRSIETSLPDIIRATARSESRGMALRALGNAAQLLSSERATSYELAEKTLVKALANTDYEARHRESAALALEGLPTLQESTINDVVQSVRDSHAPPRSAVAVMAKYSGKNANARAGLLELARNNEDRKRRLFAQQVVLRRDLDSGLLEELAALAIGDPDPDVRSWATSAFRVGYDLDEELSARLVAAFSQVIVDPAQSFDYREVTIGSLATLVRSEPEHLEVLKAICAETVVESRIRASAIGVLPFASRYAPDIRSFLEALSASGDGAVSEAVARATEIMDRRK